MDSIERERFRPSGPWLVVASASVSWLLGRREVRFLLVGAWNTVFGFGLFVVLQLIIGNVIGYAAVLLITQVIAALQAHALQRRLVWASSLRYGPELARFALVALGQFLANLALLTIGVQVLGLAVIPAALAAGVTTVVITYVVHAAWTFSHRHTPATPDGRTSIRSPEPSPVGD